jgi:DNA-binding beta-propeller fold protein YncE
MSLEFISYIDLPEHREKGGFDHAAVDGKTSRLYVAHTANNALDVIDCTGNRYLHSIPGLAGVAGALVSEDRRLVFTSNRGENTVGIFRAEDEAGLVKVPVGIRPNGLAFDPQRGLLLAANVGDPENPGSFTLSIVDVERRELVHSIPVAGRTRWTVFDAQSGVFYANISDPARIVVVDASRPDRLARSFEIPVSGPHGLDLDAENRRLFCACDGQKLVTLAGGSGKIHSVQDLSGTPDVIFFNATLKQLYVAVGDPGVIDVFDTQGMKLIETVSTEAGAHTMGFDPSGNRVYAFLPGTHRAAVYQAV